MTVDLGEMDEGLDVTRHSSLPPISPTQATHKDESREGRHGSLPPKLPKMKIRFVPPWAVQALDEVSENESKSDVSALPVSVNHGVNDSYIAHTGSGWC
jgi:hypothetical protein